MACNMLLIGVSQSIHSPPAGYDQNDMEQLKAYIQSLPASAFLLVLLAHQSQAFVGGLLGTLVSGRRSLIVAWILGAFTLLGCVMMLMIARGPIWFSILDVLLPLPLAWLAGKLVLKKDESGGAAAA